MKKINLERKVDMALTEAIKGLRSIDQAYYKTSMDVMRYHLERCVSILCMSDDWEVSERCTYYCLSEIERNVNAYLLERKMKGEFLSDEDVN